MTGMLSNCEQKSCSAITVNEIGYMVEKHIVVAGQWNVSEKTWTEVRRSKKNEPTANILLWDGGY
jgi:hypothetical protein